MAKNDTILLDGIIDRRLADALPSARRDEVFEYFAFEQVLKDYDLSREEIDAGWVDGGDDGGIDGFFTFVNGHLLRDSSTFSWPKRRPEIVLWIVTCKHHDTFQQQPLNSLYTTLSELLDLSLDRSSMKGIYSPPLLHARSLFTTAYARLASERPAVSIRFAYVSRGIASKVADNVNARAMQITQFVKDLFSSAESAFFFVGAEELIAKYRKAKKFSLAIPVQEHLSRGVSGYVVLAGLSDFAEFVTDDSGNLRRYLFDSNVRDYTGETQVNEDILGTLRDDQSPDFWWLNNGVTILTTSATMVGKTLQLEDVQIVNGLQTTESIFRYRAGGAPLSNDRVLLIKVIVSTEAIHRDRIIRATNNQNVVETAALRATDKVQRDIEEHLDRYDWYYERRKNYYRNIGKPPARFVTPLYLAAGCISLILKDPASAGGLRSRFMRNDESYSKVFSESIPLPAWVRVVEVLKRTEAVLEHLRPPQGSGERFMATWRNLVAFLSVSRVLGEFSYGVNQFIALAPDTITQQLVSEVWALVHTRESQRPFKKQVKSAAFIRDCCEDLARAFGVANIQALRSLGHVLHQKRTVGGERPASAPAKPLDASFLDQVDAALPPQPWKPGIHAEVAKKLNRSKTDIALAITLLVEAGRRNRQKDGIVYGPDGGVVATDVERHPS